MMGGAIKAKVEELTAPTNEIKRSSLGIAAAKATKIQKNKINELGSVERREVPIIFS